MSRNSRTSSIANFFSEKSVFIIYNILMIRFQKIALRILISVVSFYREAKFLCFCIGINSETQIPFENFTRNFEFLILVYSNFLLSIHKASLLNVFPIFCFQRDK